MVFYGALLLLVFGRPIVGFVSSSRENAALVTALIALVSVLITQVVNTRIAQSAQRAQQELEEQRARAEALQAYLDKAEESLTNKKLHELGEGSFLSIAIEAQTAALLERSDESGQRILVQFLYRAGLLNAHEANPIISLDNANLEDADLTVINLGRVCLRGANLKRADLREADLSESDLRYVDLRGANLTNADLSNADLSWANLLPYDREEPSSLSFRYLKDLTSPSDQDISLAMRVRARLERRRRSFTGRLTIDLLTPPLSFTNLTGTKLDGANLTGAILAGADLQNARGLTQDQINRAIGNEDTKLPSQTEVPRAWTKKPIAKQIKQIMEIEEQASDEGIGLQ